MVPNFLGHPVNSYNACETVSILDLHNSIPVVASSDAKESKKGHSEVAEVSVLAESFAVISRRTFCKFKPTKMQTSSY